MSESKQHHETAAEAIDWRTDPSFLDCVRQTFGHDIELDPCAAVDPQHHFALENWNLPHKDALKDPWVYAGRPARWFLNPPFGTSYVLPDGTALGAAEYKALREREHVLAAMARRQTLLDFATRSVFEASREGSEGVWLARATLASKAGQWLLKGASALLLPEGRVAYINAKTNEVEKQPKFASCAFYFGPHPHNFAAAFKGWGVVLDCREGRGRLAA